MPGAASVARPRSGAAIPVGTTFALGLLAVSIMAAYHNGLHTPFEFDDIASIPGNLSIRALWPLWGPLSPPPGTSLSGRPVANLTFALNTAASGTGVWSYHATNVLIHVLAAWALLLASFVIPSTGQSCTTVGRDSKVLALSVALLWALHPLGTEAVTYVVQRVESLMALFYF